ncbi:class I adenylate-forming enzyme family protein [Pseudorhodoferax sp. Leaf274]|uniref:class I adenylate-forming enzyme family protein n=1 Tax=Pseudorhodoferax sp. Leaf274 TaxID=1736318 RepID=UPI00070260DE|nr:AMP-binding protein [Pseudorhodoferax sp. Leaf274]KQP49427.1 O-succinylbenzoic acid--CoA ligase [Pseudorhodoferax sp. Leaf274]
MTRWHTTELPAMREEAVYGDRVVRCFAERPPSMHALLERAVAQYPGQDAVVHNGQRWSYRALDAEVARIAGGLAALGVQAGERVVLFMGNRPEFMAVLFAVQRLGAIAVPIGEREQRPGLAYMLQQCGACAIVFDEGLAERIPSPDEVPGLRLRLRLVVGEAPGALPLSSLRGDVRDAAPVREQDTALILYTSGTTGRPKGAMLTHLNVAHSVRHYELCMGLRAGDRSALAVPASHVTGLIAIIAAMVHIGGAVVMLSEFKAPAFLQLLETERVTHTLMVPAMYQLCLLQPAFDAARLASWRIGGYGGAPMPVSAIDAMAERLPGLTLINAYGATETTSPTTMMPPGLTRAHADSVGIALPCAQVRVVDDAGRDLPPGESGELWIGGPMVVPGYWDNPEATAANFTEGYWHSGDLGSIDAQGFVRLFDRKKDMLNRGGFKIYSVEVEHCLVALPGVVEAAIVGRPCPVLGERVHAFLYAPGLARDDEAVRAHCRARLTDYKVPETITWSDTPLPRNAGGKLLKRMLREQLA